MTRYCPDCGTGHDCESASSAAPNPEVEIARINAKRDVEVARLSAGQDRDWNETQTEIAEIEAVSGVAEAEAVAGALTDVLAPPDPEPMPEADPIVITDPGPAEPDVAPPPAGDSAGIPKEPKSKPIWGFG